MTIGIEVNPLADNEETSFANVRLRHARCEHGLLRKHRDPASGIYTLRCGCGLELELTADAITSITYTAIDEQPRTIAIAESQSITITSRTSAE
jgi:hypothetical protein